MANGGSVNVRFSVSDSEVVRQALEKLGKDGEAALKKLDAAAKGQQGVGVFGKLVGEVKDRAASMTSSLGVAGTALLSLGPTGLVAGAALGAIALGLSAVSTRVGGIREAATAIKQGAEQTSFSVAQYQAFTQVLEQQGVESERARASLSRFNIAHAQAAKGQGELYQALRQVNPELAEQFALAKSGAEALDVFIKARVEATKTQQVLLDKNAFGESGSAIASTLRAITDKGGLQAVTDQALKLKQILGPGVVDALDQTNTKNKEVARQVTRDWDAAVLNINGFLDRALKSFGGKEGDTWLAVWARGLRRLTTTLFGDAGDEIARKAEDSSKKLATAIANVPIPQQDEFKRLWNEREKAIEAYEAAKKKAETAPVFSQAAADANAAGSKVAELTDKLNAYTQAKATSAAQTTDAAKDKDERQQKINDLTREIQIEQRRIGILGEAATARERLELRQKELRLAALQQENELTGAQVAQANTQAELATRAGQIAQRVQLGVADAGERRKLIEDQVAAAVANSTIKETDRARAIALGTKALKETMEQEEIRASRTPELTRIIVNSRDKLRAVDQLAAGVLNNLENAAGSFAVAMGTVEYVTENGIKRVKTGAEKAREAIKALVDSVLRDITRLMTRQFVSTPLSSLLSSLFNSAPTPNADGNAFDGRGIVPFANGGVVSNPTLFKFANGTGLMGEAGPEAIMPLRRLSNGRLGVETEGGRGGLTLQVNVTGVPAGHTADAKMNRNSKGQPQLDVQFRRMQTAAFAEDIGNGGDMARMLEARYALRPQLA
jgi:hypothetical protein